MTSGPFGPTEFAEMARSGVIARADLVWSDGMANWVSASSVRGLLAEVVNAPPPLPLDSRSSASLGAKLFEESVQSDRELKSVGPQLWNPFSAALWSALFSPAFGAWIHAKNWTALGEKKKSRDSMIVVYMTPAIVVAANFLPDMLGAAVGPAFLFGWYYGAGKEQVDRIKKEFGTNYAKKSWFQAIAISTLVFFTILMVMVGVASIFDGKADSLSTASRTNSPDSAVPESTASTLPETVRAREPVPAIQDIEITGEEYDRSLYINKQLLMHGDAYAYSVEAAYKIAGDAVYLVQSSMGGMACPAQYFFISISQNAVASFTPEFGTCSDLAKSRVVASNIEVTMPSMTEGDVARFLLDNDGLKENSKALYSRSQFEKVFLADWNVKDLSISNGNMLLAVGHLKSEIVSSYIDSGAAAEVLTAPWKFYGKLLCFSGLALVVESNPPGSEGTELFGGGEVSEVLIQHVDGTILDFFLMGSSDTLRAGSRASMCGFPVAREDVENQFGGSSKQLILVGRFQPPPLTNVQQLISPALADEPAQTSAHVMNDSSSISHTGDYEPWLKGPSFDCADASTLVEDTICGDTDLSSMDAIMTSNYNDMLHVDIGDITKASLRTTQREWIKQRNQCRDRACLASLYETRIDEVCIPPIITGVHPSCETWPPRKLVD